MFDPFKKYFLLIPALLLGGCSTPSSFKESPKADFAPAGSFSTGIVVHSIKLDLEPSGENFGFLTIQLGEGLGSYLSPMVVQAGCFRKISSDRMQCRLNRLYWKQASGEILISPISGWVIRLEGSHGIPGEIFQRKDGDDIGRIKSGPEVEIMLKRGFDYSSGTVLSRLSEDSGLIELLLNSPINSSSYGFQLALKTYALGIEKMLQDLRKLSLDLKNMKIDEDPAVRHLMKSWMGASEDTLPQKHERDSGTHAKAGGVS